MDTDPDYLQARRRVRSLRGFYIHLVLFVSVIAFLAILNSVTAGPWWVQWVVLGWGIGIVAHAVAVFGVAGWLDSGWEERKIRELMAKKPEV